MKYIGEAMARAVFSSIDFKFSQLSPKFNVTVGKTNYLYDIKKINSTTFIAYEQASETGCAVTTMVSDVELTSGRIKLSETVRFVVRLCY
jgi:hypothetical protein